MEWVKYLFWRLWRKNHLKKGSLAFILKYLPENCTIYIPTGKYNECPILKKGMDLHGMDLC
jgi:hypothetical protein